jgi:chromate reductase
MKVLLFAGSLRKDSLNKKMIIHVQKYLSSKLAIDATIIDLQPLHLPVYDGDIEAQSIPEGVNMLGRFISEADAVIISSPEYNGSISSPLKNTIDWISRLKPMPLEKKPVLLLGASPGALGAIRALGHARAPFEAIGSFVFPQSFGLAKAHEAFSAEGSLIAGPNQERLEKLLNSFIEYHKKV